MAVLARNIRLFSANNNSNFLCKSLVSLSAYLSTCAVVNLKKEPALIANPQHFDYLINKYQFSPQTVTMVDSFFANNYIISKRRPNSLALQFLKETGFSNAQLEMIVKSKPSLLFSSIEKTIKPKIRIFQQMGFSDADIVEVLSNDRLVFARDVVTTIHPVLSALKGLLGSNARVVKLLRNTCWSFFEVPEKALMPNIDLLKSCGVPMEQISSCLYLYPNFFLLNPEKVRKSIAKIDEMGVGRTSKLFIHAVKVVSSMSDATWELKLKTFMDLGFSEQDISRVLRSSPLVLSVSDHRIKKVKEVLLETGKYDMTCIIQMPDSLMNSVEKRYKPRVRILKDLEKRGLISKWPSLGSLCKMTDDKFRKRFVALSGTEVVKEGSLVPR